MLVRNILKYSSFLPEPIAKKLQNFLLDNVNSVGFYQVDLPNGKPYYFYLDLKERSDRNMYINNQFEKYNCLFLSKILKENSTFFDIGGYRGYYSILAHHFMKGTGDIVIFEPDKKNYFYIKETIKKNKIKNIKIENLAISKTSGKVPFYISNSESTHSLGKANDNFFEGKFTQIKKIFVNTISLDEYLTKTSYYPDIIKIDVEGAELDVLKGMKNNIKKRKPEILLEIHEQKLPSFNYNADDLYNYFKYLKLTPYLIKKNKLIEIKDRVNKDQYTIYLK